MTEALEWIETSDENALRSHIFQQDDRPELLVEVPEWRTRVLIKALSGKARSEFLAFQVALQREHADTPHYFKRLWFEMILHACVHPITKKPIFKVADRDTFMDDKNGSVLQMLGETIQAFCNFDSSVSVRAKKNLASTLNTTATSNSPNGSEACGTSEHS